MVWFVAGDCARKILPHEVDKQEDYVKLPEVLQDYCSLRLWKLFDGQTLGLISSRLKRHFKEQTDADRDAVVEILQTRVFLRGSEMQGLPFHFRS